MSIIYSEGGVTCVPFSYITEGVAYVPVIYSEVGVACATLS